MTTLNISLGELVDRTLLELTSPGEQGMRVVLGSNGLGSTSDTSLTLVDAAGVNPSDLIELGNELVLVTAKSSDLDPIFTVSRGYYMTVPAVHAPGAVGHANPPFPRRRVAEAIRRSFARLEAMGVMHFKAVTVTRIPGHAYVDLPADCREVLDVLYWANDGRLWPMQTWRFFDRMPLGKFANGKALNIARYVSDSDELEVVYRAPYRWSANHPNPTEDDTVEMAEGSEDLPSLYAAAWLVTSREISRADLDRSEEWGRTEGYQSGVTSALVRSKWQEFYRALDEARKLVRAPQSLVYVGRPRI